MIGLKPKDRAELGGFARDDPFRLEDQLDDDERLIRDAAHAFALDWLQPRVIAAFREE
jgi:glutaryl-CoA dehydrogenase